MNGSYKNLDYLNSPKRLSEDEWSWLVQSGSQEVHFMITNFTRINNDSDLQGVWDWLAINATNFYFVKSYYQYATIYFLDPIDKDNFNRMQKNYISSQY